MHKRILTIDELVRFCEQHNFTSFSSKDSGYQMCVQVPATFEKEEFEDDTLLMGTVKLMHSGENRNKSCVTEEALKKCMSTIAYKPILANFTDVNGELDFTSHDFEFNDDGSVVYYEKQVGCFTSDEPVLEVDKNNADRTYVYAKCAIPRNYTEAADIIERKDGTKISAELGINKMSYDAQKKILLLEDVVLLGATLLGVDPVTGDEIQEGMEGARLDTFAVVDDGSSSIFLSEEMEEHLIRLNEYGNYSSFVNEITQAVMDRLDNHKAVNSADENQRKEECGMDFKENNKVTEVEEAEVKATEEETPEVVEAESVEFEDADADVDSDVDETDEVEADADEGSEGVEESDDENGSSEVEETVETDGSEEIDSSVDEKKSGEYSVNFNGKTFSLSLNEKLNALFELVNSTYGESDNAFYSVDAYDDEKIVLMHDWWNNKHYRQSYSVKKDVYSLKGDRVEVFCTYLTRDEQAQLDDMKSNYSMVSEKLEKYESEPEKMALLESSDYENIVGQVEFENLKKQENHFDLTVEEVKNKADAMLLQYAKSGKLHFAEKKEEKNEKQDFFAFSRNENNGFLDSLLKIKRGN